MWIRELIEPRTAAPCRRRGAGLGQDGAAMVEFAFVAPLFIGLVCAILEFSGIMFVQAILEGSARYWGLVGLLHDECPARDDGPRRPRGTLEEV